METDRLIKVDHKDPILRTFILLFQTARAVLKCSDAYLYRKTQLSAIKLIVLRVLAYNGGVMMPSQLAKWTQTERHNITTLIDRMRKEGLVTTTRSIVNKRNMNVILTDKGREVLNRAMPVAREVIDQVMLSITESDAALLEKTLSTLRQNACDGLENVAKFCQP